MFSKIKKTAFPPSERPIMVWDGECGFCNYWITRWKSKTNGKINYRPFQEVASHFKDIPLKEFKKASRLIETDGSVFSGPDSAFRSFYHFEKSSPQWHKWYLEKKWFASISDNAYNFIAKHRSFMLTLTKLFFGKDPESLKPYWFLILLFLFSTFYLLLKYL